MIVSNYFVLGIGGEKVKPIIGRTECSWTGTTGAREESESSSRDPGRHMAVALRKPPGSKKPGT